MKSISLNNEPYRLLFSCGVVSGVLGLVLWVLFQADYLPFYPKQSHANIMYFGFLWSFVAGFLMTAIPKMTGTPLANAFEITTAMVLVGLQIIVNFLNLVPISIFVFLLQTALVISFVGRRFILKRHIPFEGFVFIPFAFLQPLLAIGLFYFYENPSLTTFYRLAGEASILNLVLGLGTRLVPVLSRVPNSLSPDQKADKNNFVVMAALAILLNVSFIVQTFFSETIGVALRLLLIGYISLKYFKILSKVTTKSFVGFGLRCGIVSILSSYVILLFQPTQVIAVQHLLYIGGFVLITFMVGTRVMLAHGGQSLDYETSSSRIGGVALLLGLTSLLRLFAGSNTMGWLMQAGILFFILAMLVWFHKFLKILNSNR